MIHHLLLDFKHVKLLATRVLSNKDMKSQLNESQW